NKRYRYLIETGATGLSCAFDLPTQIGYDSDHPMAEGEIGKVGVAIGKANQVQFAVSKAESQARRSTIKFPVEQGTIPHEIIGKFGSASVWMKPAAPGTGVIAGAGVRLILEAAGIKNILAKSLGSNNACNLAYATIEALKLLKNKDAVLSKRGKAVAEKAPLKAEEAAPAAAEAGAA
ncbi:MAG: methylmalonyl-CoA mutase family protein, partial [Elusimicrobiota bacterium]|nr:methylmalonyl-CoA mutase family protein [Elusimicrobiota bacterium]